MTLLHVGAQCGYCDGGISGEAAAGGVGPEGITLLRANGCAAKREAKRAAEISPTKE